MSDDDFAPSKRWANGVPTNWAARSARLQRRRRWVNTLAFLVTAGLVVGLAYVNRDALLPAIEDVLAAPTPEPEAPADPPPAAQPAPAPAPALVSFDIPSGARKATVDYVHDGDTLFLVQNGRDLKVRLLGVDTPEIGHNAECYGAEATAFTRSLLPEGATVFTVADVEPLDQYGRFLLFIYTADGTLVNYELVAGGYAEAVFIGGNRMLEAEFEDAEDEAQAGGSGVWGAC